MHTVECQDSNLIRTVRTSNILHTQIRTHTRHLGWKLWTGASVCGWQISLATVTLRNHILGVSHTLIVRLSHLKGCVCTPLKPASVCYFRGAAKSHSSFQAGVLSTTPWGVVLLRYDQNWWVLFNFWSESEVTVQIRLFEYNQEQAFSGDQLFFFVLPVWSLLFLLSSNPQVWQNLQCSLGQWWWVM